MVGPRVPAELGELAVDEPLRDHVIADLARVDVADLDRPVASGSASAPIAAVARLRRRGNRA